MKTTLFMLLMGLFLLPKAHYAQGDSPKTTYLLDADTGNEVDDLFAIARALIEPSWEISALTAAHWQTAHWAEAQTMENSYRINTVLRDYLQVDVKTLRGGVARMFDWGDQAQHSAAAYEIIAQAKALPEGEKLNVIALGALTNVASAVFINPSIGPKLRLYWLGTTYDFEEGILGTTDFNCMMDQQALHYLFKSPVELHIIPVSVASAMTFEMYDVEAKLRDVHPLGAYLCDRWYNHLDGSRYERVIWDLALIQAIIHPEMAELTTITTSKDFGSREVHYYSSIDANKMRAEFYESLTAYLKGL